MSRIADMVRRIQLVPKSKIEGDSHFEQWWGNQIETKASCQNMYLALLAALAPYNLRVVGLQPICITPGKTFSASF